jgi:hypothetical protein
MISCARIPVLRAQDDHRIEPGGRGGLAGRQQSLAFVVRQEPYPPARLLGLADLAYRVVLDPPPLLDRNA